MTTATIAQNAASPTAFLRRPSTLLLAAALALEVFGANALAQRNGAVDATAAADGQTIYTQTASVDVIVLAVASIPAH